MTTVHAGPGRGKAEPRTKDLCWDVSEMLSFLAFLRRWKGRRANANHWVLACWSQNLVLEHGQFFPNVQAFTSPEHKQWCSDRWQLQHSDWGAATFFGSFHSFEDTWNFTWNILKPWQIPGDIPSESMLQARISKTFDFLKRQNKHPHVRYPSLVRCQCLHGLALGVQLCGFLADLGWLWNFVVQAKFKLCLISSLHISQLRNVHNDATEARPQPDEFDSRHDQAPRYGRPSWCILPGEDGWPMIPSFHSWDMLRLNQVLLMHLKGVTWHSLVPQGDPWWTYLTAQKYGGVRRCQCLIVWEFGKHWGWKKMNHPEVPAAPGLLWHVWSTVLESQSWKGNCRKFCKLTPSVELHRRRPPFAVSPYPVGQPAALQAGVGGWRLTLSV